MNKRYISFYISLASIYMISVAGDMCGIVAARVKSGYPRSPAPIFF